MTTNSAALKRDGVRVNNRPSFTDENFKRLLTSTIREVRTLMRRDGANTYDIVQWLDEYLRSQNVTSKVADGSIILPSGRFVLEHYWVKSGDWIIDPTIDKFRTELSLDVGYFNSSDAMSRRYVEQKHADEDEERSYLRARAKRLGLSQSQL